MTISIPLKLTLNLSRKERSSNAISQHLTIQQALTRPSAHGFGVFSCYGKNKWAVCCLRAGGQTRGHKIRSWKVTTKQLHCITMHTHTSQRNFCLEGLRGHRSTPDKRHSSGVKHSAPNANVTQDTGIAASHFGPLLHVLTKQTSVTTRNSDIEHRVWSQWESSAQWVQADPRSCWAVCMVLVYLEASGAMGREGFMHRDWKGQEN